jgi:hypothetical protein
MQHYEEPAERPPAETSAKVTIEHDRGGSHTINDSEHSLENAESNSNRDQLPAPSHISAQTTVARLTCSKTVRFNVIYLLL